MPVSILHPYVRTVLRPYLRIELRPYLRIELHSLASVNEVISYQTYLATQDFSNELRPYLRTALRPYLRTVLRPYVRTILCPYTRQMLTASWGQAWAS